MEYNVQTLPYRAPEVLFGMLYNEQIDMWSYGLVVELCLGRAFLDANTKEAILCRFHLGWSSCRSTSTRVATITTSSGHWRPAW